MWTWAPGGREPHPGPCPGGVGLAARVGPLIRGTAAVPPPVWAVPAPRPLAQQCQPHIPGGCQPLVPGQQPGAEHPEPRAQLARGVAPGQGWPPSGLGETERNKQIRGESRGRGLEELAAGGLPLPAGPPAAPRSTQSSSRRRALPAPPGQDWDPAGKNTFLPGFFPAAAPGDVKCCSTGKAPIKRDGPGAPRARGFPAASRAELSPGFAAGAVSGAGKGEASPPARVPRHPRRAARDLPVPPRGN